MFAQCFRGAAVFFLSVCSLISAWDDTPKCFREIESSFFQSKTVLLALQYYQEDYSAQGQWDPFVRDLLNRNSQIPARMRQAGKRLQPNPLEHPFDKKGAKKLLREVTKEIFMEGMARFQPVIGRDWNGVFNYIFDTELERIDACLGER